MPSFLTPTGVNLQVQNVEELIHDYETETMPNILKSANEDTKAMAALRKVRRVATLLRDGRTTSGKVRRDMHRKSTAPGGFRHESAGAYRYGNPSQWAFDMSPL